MAGVADLAILRIVGKPRRWAHVKKEAGPESMQPAPRVAAGNGGRSPPAEGDRNAQFLATLGSLKTHIEAPWVTCLVRSAMSPPHRGTAPP